MQTFLSVSNRRSSNQGSDYGTQRDTTTQPSLNVRGPWIVFNDCMTNFCFFVLLVSFSSFNPESRSQLTGAFRSISLARYYRTSPLNNRPCRPSISTRQSMARDIRVDADLVSPTSPDGPYPTRRCIATARNNYRLERASSARGTTLTQRANRAWIHWLSCLRSNLPR